MEMEFASNHLQPAEDNNQARQDLQQSEEVDHGQVNEVMSIYPLDEKFKSFGFEVITIDGHNIEKIIQQQNMRES